jgi:kynureninase
MTTIDRSRAEALDAADPLARFRDRFLPQGADVVAYLDGNSLGRPIRAVREAWLDLVDRQWGERLIRSWTPGPDGGWMELPEQVGDELAGAMLGAAPGQTIIADSTTINFYKALRAALALRPDRRVILMDRDNFPTDRFVAESIATEFDYETRWVPSDFADPIGDDVAVLTASHIAYHSGYVADVAAITARAHEAGAVVVWDLCHSVGVYPVQLDAWQVDFAVGCTYKFVGGGPGAPAFLYAATRHHDNLRQPLWGWLGRRDPFEMEQGYLPAAGVRSMMSGTPSIPGILAVRAGTALIAEAGIEAIRDKSVALTEFAIDMYDAVLAPLGFDLGSPRESQRRGGHVTIRRGDARELTQAIIARGVIPDFRTPDGIRLGLSPLPASFTEVWDAVEIIRQVAAAG